MTLSAVMSVAADSSDAKTLIGMINVGSMTVVTYLFLFGKCMAGGCFSHKLCFGALYGGILRMWCVFWTCRGWMLVFVKGGLDVSRYR
jgi:hypothetical protein